MLYAPVVVQSRSVVSHPVPFPSASDAGLGLLTDANPVALLLDWVMSLLESEACMCKDSGQQCRYDTLT